MSTISAGTTTPTALSLSGDTTGALTFQVNGTTTAATLSAAGNFSLATGNLTFSSTAQRITGDFSTGTLLNRLLFQSSTTNGGTIVGAVPNGTSKFCRYQFFDNSDPANAAAGDIGVTGVEMQVRSITTGTGTYLPMTFATGGSERMRLDTSGNALLGTTTGVAGSRLTVVGGGTQLSPGTTAQEGVRIQRATGYATFTGINNDNNAYNGLQFFTGASAAATIDTSGNVGIGTTTAAAGGLLTLNRAPAAAFGTPMLQVGGASFTSGGYYSIGLGFTDATYTEPPSEIAFVTTSDSGGTLGAITFGTRSVTTNTAVTERMRISSSGNVGIGTASPGAKLTVNSSGVAPAAFTMDNYYYVDFVANQATSSIGFSMSVRNGSGTFLPSGYVTAVGGSSPEMGFIAPGTSNGAIVFGRNNGSGGLVESLRISSSGEVLAGGATDQGAYNLQCNGTGVWGAGAYVNGSDARLKDNIQSLESGLDVVKAMRPVTFQYKPEYSKDQSVQPGFIAQELQTAMAGKPYLEGVVQEGTNHLNVAYQSIIPILVKAIQELKAENDALKARIEALEIR